MNEPTPSMPDVAEELMREFENLIPVSTVTEVVMRLTRRGQGTLSAIAELAREELRVVATAAVSHVQNPAAAVKPGFEPQPEGV